MTTPPMVDAEMRTRAREGRRWCGNALRWLDPRYGDVDKERALANARQALSTLQVLVYHLEDQTGVRGDQAIAP